MTTYDGLDSIAPPVPPRSRHDNYTMDVMKVGGGEHGPPGKGLTRTPGWARRGRARIRREEGGGEVATRVGARASVRGEAPPGDEEVVLDGPVSVRELVSAPRVRDRVPPRGVPEPLSADGGVASPSPAGVPRYMPSGLRGRETGGVRP